MRKDSGGDSVEGDMTTWRDGRMSRTVSVASAPKAWDSPGAGQSKKSEPFNRAQIDGDLKKKRESRVDH